MKYTAEFTDNCAKAMGVALPISYKYSLMVCQAIRGLPIAKAKKILEDAIDLKSAIPFTRFTNGPGHKPGMGTGRFAVKACAHILNLIVGAEANAQFKGLSTGNLFVKHIIAKQGPNTLRQGRKYRQAKRTHVEVILEEVKAKKND